jgi:hypothetical protein
MIRQVRRGVVWQVWLSVVVQARSGGRVRLGAAKTGGFEVRQARAG